jgi:hypothetical protein
MSAARHWIGNRTLDVREHPVYLWTVVGLCGVFVYLAWLVRSMAMDSYDTWGGLVIAPVLVGVSIPLLLRFARRADDDAMAGIFIAALVFKLAGSLVRYFVVFSVYGGNDSVAYHDWGVKLAPMIRSGDFAVKIPVRLIGTGFIEVATGWLYAITNPTIVGGYLVFSWLGFWGLYFFYRAFRIAVPGGDHRRYALMVFFLPSLLFWSSSIGKEAWMTFTLGIAAYGVARMLTYRRGGIVMLLAGLGGTIMVRPHVSLVVFLALSAAFILRPARRPSITSPLAKVGGLVLLALVGVVVLSQVQNFFGVKQLDTTGVESVLNRTTTQSSEGGSQYQAETVSGPLGFLDATTAVVFRPWPFEAHNFMSLLASMEGVLLLALFVTSYRRLVALPRAMVKIPYVAFSVVFSLCFIFAFAAVGNFGIMVRQRVQLFPFLLVVLAIPVAMPRRKTPAVEVSAAEAPVGVAQS